VSLAVGVGQKLHAQAVLLSEGLMRSGIVPRDAKDRDAEHLELGEVVGELAGFGRAARRVVLRVEVHDVTRPFQVLCRDDLPILIGEREGGCLIPGFELHP